MDPCQEIWQWPGQVAVDEVNVTQNVYLTPITWYDPTEEVAKPQPPQLSHVTPSLGQAFSQLIVAQTRYISFVSLPRDPDKLPFSLLLLKLKGTAAV